MWPFVEMERTIEILCDGPESNIFNDPSSDIAVQGYFNNDPQKEFALNQAQFDQPGNQNEDENA